MKPAEKKSERFPAVVAPGGAATTMPGNPRNGLRAFRFVAGMTTRTDAKCESAEKSSQFRTARGQRVGAGRNRSKVLARDNACPPRQRPKAISWEGKGEAVAESKMEAMK
jgi:uncharacterized protein YaiL (DUF2058 family)